MNGSKALADVEGFLNISVDDIACFSDYDRYLDYCAEKIGYPLLQNIDTEPVEINADKTIKIRVSGQVEVDDGEDENPEA